MIEKPRLRVLVYDPKTTIQDALTQMRKQHSVTIVHDAGEAQTHLLNIDARWHAVVTQFGGNETRRDKSKRILSLAEECNIPSVALAELDEDRREAARYADAVADKHQPPRNLTEAIHTARKSRKSHILIMDSEASVARAFSNLLENHQPIILPDSIHGLGHIKRHYARIAAAVVDIDTPGGHMDRLYRELYARKIPYVATYSSAMPAQTAILQEFEPDATLLKTQYAGLDTLVKKIKRPID